MSRHIVFVCRWCRKQLIGNVVSRRGKKGQKLMFCSYECNAKHADGDARSPYSKRFAEQEALSKASREACEVARPRGDN